MFELFSDNSLKRKKKNPFWLNSQGPNPKGGLVFGQNKLCDLKGVLFTYIVKRDSSSTHDSLRVNGIFECSHIIKNC